MTGNLTTPRGGPLLPRSDAEEWASPVKRRGRPVLPAHHRILRSMTWPSGTPGVIEFPSGLRVRGRRWRDRPDLTADFGLYLRWTRPLTDVPHRWVRWPDFALPLDDADARDAIGEAWRRASSQRVEVARGGGRGRTGTALAALAMLDGLELDAAIAWVRRHYHRRAVETPWQKRWLTP